MASASASASGSQYDYEYMDESKVHDLLKCKICKKPFIDPVTTSDNRRFCRACFVHDNNSTRPTVDISDSLAPVTETLVLEMLNAILVRCIRCGMKDIERGKFIEHISTICPKAQVQCTAADVKCPWVGAREELDDHYEHCRFESLRPVLAEIMYEQSTLRRRIEALEVQLLGQRLEQTDVNY